MLDPLFPASFRGVPFWVEKDEATKGRRLVVHEFSHRDRPFVEDMGRSARRWSVTAYLASEAALEEGRALVAACEARGAGTLVLPWDGPMQARCATAQPTRAKDRQGFVAFQLAFVEEGAAAALFTVDLGAQLVFDAAQALGAALASLPSGDVSPAAIDATRAAWADVPAALEAIRVDAPVAPDLSRALEQRFAQAFAAVDHAVTRAGLDPAFAPRLVDDALALGDALDPEVAAVRFAEAADYFGGETPADCAGRAAMFAAEAEAQVRRVFGDRPAAQRARRAWSERADRLAAAASALPAPELYVAARDLAGALHRWVSAAMTDLKDVRVIDVARPLPAALLAWRLYADPSRADEIVARNAAAHPGFVGPRVVALAA